MSDNTVVGWQRQLEDGRIEIFLRCEEPALKIRAHGEPPRMNELLDWFEGHAGCAVDAPWRERKGPRPLRGQMDLLDDEYAQAAA